MQIGIVSADLRKGMITLQIHQAGDMNETTNKTDRSSLWLGPEITEHLHSPLTDPVTAHHHLQIEPRRQSNHPRVQNYRRRGSTLAWCTHAKLGKRNRRV